MQSKQLQNSSVRNMTGVYLGMAGSPAGFSHIAAVPPLFRRRCLSRAKTSVELRRNKRIEMLRVMDCQPGFKGALVKPKVKIVCPEMKPHPYPHDKSPPLTAEELRNLTRKVLRNFGVPGRSTRDMLGRSKRRSCFLSSPKTPPNSSRQSNNPELSVAANAGRNTDPFRVTLARQELITTRAGHQEIFEVPITTPSTDSRVANGSSRMDTLKSKATPSAKVRSPFNSRTKTSFYSKINTQGTGTGKHRITDTCEDKIQDSVEEENSKDLVVEPSDLKQAEDSQTSNLNDDEDDEDTLEMDSTTHLAKQIEVIIHLKPKVDSSAECSSEKDPEQTNSNEASI